MTKPLALIIEDDPQLGQIFSIALQSRFSTELITDGDTALARLSEANPMVIVLDLHLPGVSGKDILTQIRADPRLSKTSVIVSTADALLAEMLQDEGDIVLVKPVSPVQLSELASRLYPGA